MRNHHPNLRTTALALAGLFALLIGGAGYYILDSAQQSAEEIIQANSRIADSAVQRLAEEAEEGMITVWPSLLEDRQAITRREERLADSLLSSRVGKVLEAFDGVEGGIYFLSLDEFIGYAYPSIPSPKPAFGPPPRSYNIIREQARRSARGAEKIIELHRFDPAIFPLATQPIALDGEVIGAVWARTHIERELSAAANVSTYVVRYGLALALLGFVVALVTSWRQRRRIDEVREGLVRMKHDVDYRLPERRGVLGYVSGFINEMVEAHQQEQERREQLERELFQKEKMATLGDLVAGAAHEINTPISIIKTRVQMWERRFRRLSEQEQAGQVISHASLDLVNSEVERVTLLVKRLLKFAKPVGQLKQAVDLNQMLRETTRWLRAVFGGRTIEVHFDLDPALPTLRLDPVAIEQLLQNLFKNSVEASEGVPELWIATRLEEDGHRITIEIADDAAGIPEGQHDQVFTPFFTTKDHGTGLGLAISYEIVRAHRGTIRFSARHPRGSVCTIELPVATRELVPA